MTLNAGVIAGGTRPNVVPAECRVQLDLRAATADAFDPPAPRWSAWPPTARTMA